MEVTELQKQVDAVEWYHEFDFPNGVKARSRGPDAADHRKLWTFITTALDTVDFTDKTVLDIGCWDGYWSFYAERRGAARVLATDDASQNWSRSRGLSLAKKLLGSKIETKTDVSIYELGKLNRTFDVISVSASTITWWTHLMPSPRSGIDATRDRSWCSRAT